MADVVYLAFNRGIVSPLGLARVDVKRLALAAETSVNWVPRVLGAMAIRPGLGYQGGVLNNSVARMLKFVFSTSDKALIELTDAKMRVWVDGAALTRPSYDSVTAITNGGFTTDVSGWTDSDESGGTSQWATGGYLQFSSNDIGAARRYQEVPFSGADEDKVIGLAINVARGPVKLKVGKYALQDDLVAETTLLTGTHSIGVVVTPALDGGTIGTNVSVSALTGTHDGTSNAATFRCSGGKSTGKWYFEGRPTSPVTAAGVGVGTASATLTVLPGKSSGGWGYLADGHQWNANSDAGANGATWANGDIIGVAVDCDAHTAAFYKNNSLQFTTSSITSAELFPLFGLTEAATTMAAGLSASSCTYTPPSGFKYWGGSFYVQLESRLTRATLVDSIAIESSGEVEVDAPWAAEDLGGVRYDQSGDVIFVACDGYQQRRIERRDNNSWSVVLYAPEDGPFRVENVSTTTITPSAISGNITLTASTPIFRSGHVGALFSLTSIGQTVTGSLTAENTWTNAIRVTGVDTSRAFTVTTSGASANVKWTLQYSLDSDAGPWTDVTDAAFVSETTNSTFSFNDGFDNQIVYYRIGVKTGDYVSGTLVPTLTYAVGSIRGVARVTAFTSALVVSAEVIEELGATTATDVWAEGEWSTLRGFPTAVVLYEGRLWWSGRNGVWGSISDAYDAFDPDFEGDAGPIARTVGSGPVDVINWIAALQRLLLGAQGTEWSCRSSTFDEPLTPSNFNIKTASTQGSAPVQAVKLDGTALYVQRGGTRVFELAFDGQTYDYGSQHMSDLAPEIGRPGIVRMDAQRQPDTRVHFVRSDGVVALLVFDKNENVRSWQLIQTDGTIEDVCVLPGDPLTEEDEVYYVVARTVNGSTVRYLERWADQADCETETGSDENVHLADSYVLYDGTPTATIPAAHLEGEEVVCWADGVDVGAHTVSGGNVTLTTAASKVMVGLPYTAQWRSAKLAGQLQSAMGTSLSKVKGIQNISLILGCVHARGLTYGPDFTTMRSLPLIMEGATVDEDDIHSEFDEQSVMFPTRWGSDPRLCLQAAAPRPCTVLAVVADATSG